MRNLKKVLVWFVLVLVFTFASACNKDGVTVAGKGRKGDSGLKPGINYMQPMKWRVTYNYRVQEITPKVRFISPRAMPGFSGINAVGAGNYEVWFTGPREGEGVRDVKLVNALPTPTKVSTGSETEPIYYYYNFSPGKQLPDQISATLTWEFTTFERYAHWKGMEVGEYDKESELYKTYTKEEDPIDFEREMVAVAKDIQKKADGDPMQTALGCYNYIVANFTYDYYQQGAVMYGGLDALPNASICWQNKHGVCDEFATLFCAMTRSVGIPSRPVAGFSHGSMLATGEETDDLVVDLFRKVEKKYGPYLSYGGHAWAEYYMPNIGWVPLDPTWGTSSSVIESYYSRIGNNRNIPVIDYYFGKMDPYRVALYKDWNYTLDPTPVTPGAEPVQDWMVGCTERTDGIHEMIHGWEGLKSAGHYGYYRSADYAGSNFEFRIEALGPAKSDEVKPLIASIRDEGDHYLRVPGVKGSWPMVTIGEGFEDTWMEMIDNIEKEAPKEEKANKMMEDKVFKFFNPDGE